MRASFVLCVMIACGALTHAMAHAAAPHLAPDGDQRPLTNDELRVRVDQYLHDASAAERDYGPIGEWDTSEVTDMSGLFPGEALPLRCKSFNADIGTWDVSSVTDMSDMFLHCHAFNQDLNEWDVSNVLDFTAMFEYAKSFNGDITGWVIHDDAENFGGMFSNAESFDQCLPWVLSKSFARESGMFRKSQGSGPKCGDDKPQCLDLNRKKCNKRDDCFYHPEEKCIVAEVSDLDRCLTATKKKRCIKEMEGCQWLNRGEVCVPLGYTEKVTCDFYTSRNRCGLMNHKCHWNFDRCEKYKKNTDWNHPGYFCSDPGTDTPKGCEAKLNCIWNREHDFCVDVRERRRLRRDDKPKDDKPTIEEMEAKCLGLNRKKCNKRTGCFYHPEEKCIVAEISDLDTCLTATKEKQCIREMEGCHWLKAGKVCVPLGQKKAKCDFYASKNRCGLNRKCTWDIDHCKKQKRTGCDFSHACGENDETQEECSAMRGCVWDSEGGFCDVKGRRLRGGC